MVPHSVPLLKLIWLICTRIVWYADVLDANKVPADVDIVAKGCMYPIYFKLDEVVSGEEENFYNDDLLDDGEAEGEDHEMEDADNNQETGGEQNDQVHGSLEKSGQRSSVNIVADMLANN